MSNSKFKRNPAALILGTFQSMKYSAQVAKQESASHRMKDSAQEQQDRKIAKMKEDKYKDRKLKSSETP